MLKLSVLFKNIFNDTDMEKVYPALISNSDAQV